MTTSLRMDEDQSHMTKRIFSLTLEIICLLTREKFPPVKSGDHVTITVPPPHSLISEGHNKHKILEITRKMIELLTGEVPMRCQDVTVYFSMEEWQYIEGHQDLYKDAMMENQPPLTSPNGSSNRNPPEGCTGPLYSWDCLKEVPTTPRHHQGGDMIHVRAVVKEEEEEAYVRSDQQSMEEGDMMGKIKEEEEEMYVRSDQQSMEEGDMMRTSKEEEEEETYVRSDQQSMEEGDMMRTSKEEEEETYVRSDQQSMEEGDMMRTSKEEEEETRVRRDQQSMEEGDVKRASKEEDVITRMSTGRSPDIRNLSETRLSVSTDCTTDDDVTGQESPADITVTPNIPPDSPHLSNPEGPPTQHSSPPAGGSYCCSMCGKCFLWKSSLVRHERSHTGEKPYSCAECGKCFGYKSTLVTHGRSHAGEKPYSCAECGKCFAEKSNLVRHERSHTGEKPYSCAECGKLYKSSANLHRHERSHTGDKRYSCGNFFKNSANLHIYEKFHTGEKHYSCAKCKKCYEHKSHLVRHERSHTGEKPYSCAECGKKFVQKSLLIRHERSHTGEKPYSCAECGKCYGHKSHLVRHERSHTGEKPYSCAECGKCYGHKSLLVTHERSHTGEKPYSCAECGKCYGYKSLLVKHKRSHTGEKPYSCAECGKKFVQESHLVTHERSHTVHQQIKRSSVQPYVPDLKHRGSWIHALSDQFSSGQRRPARVESGPSTGSAGRQKSKKCCQCFTKLSSSYAKTLCQGCIDAVIASESSSIFKNIMKSVKRDMNDTLQKFKESILPPVSVPVAGPSSATETVAPSPTPAVPPAPVAPAPELPPVSFPVLPGLLGEELEEEEDLEGREYVSDREEGENVYSGEDSEDDMKRASRFLCNTDDINDLLKAVYATEQISETPKELSAQDLVYSGLAQQSGRVFPFHQSIKKIIGSQWKEPERKLFIPKAAKRKFPFSDSDINQFVKCPKLDAALSKHSKGVFINKLPRDQVKAKGLTKEIEKLISKRVIVSVPPVQELKGYYSHVFLVSKANGEFRFILNLKSLNPFLVYKKFRMENIYSVRSLLQGREFFVAIDLQDAYLHIPIAESHQKFLRFAVRIGRPVYHFQFQALPFGIASAPRIFTKVLSEVMKVIRQQGIIIVPYLDDLLIFANSEEKVRRHRDLVIQILSRLGWMLNYQKSKLNPTQSIVFLGYVIDSVGERIFLTTEKIVASTTVGQITERESKVNFDSPGLAQTSMVLYSTQSLDPTTSESTSQAGSIETRSIVSCQTGVIQTLSLDPERLMLKNKGVSDKVIETLLKCRKPNSLTGSDDVSLFAARSPGIRNLSETRLSRSPIHVLSVGNVLGINQRLDVHERSHTGEKPYSCAESHTGEKPYSCAECGKCFWHKENSTAQVHQELSTGEQFGPSLPATVCCKKLTLPVTMETHPYGSSITPAAGCERSSLASPKGTREVAGSGEETLLEEAAASCADHMTTSLRMDEDQSHMTERIFNLTLEIIYLLTGESFPPVKSSDHVNITVPPPHFLISEGHRKQKILEITRKMIELLIGEQEWKYREGHQDLYKDTMTENQPPLTSPDVSSKTNPPERCTGPLYSQGCLQEDRPTPHHYQGGELIHVSAVVKEEGEETYVRSDQQSVEEGDKMGTNKEEEQEIYLRSDQSAEDGEVMGTNKEEREETYVRSDQQSMEEGDMMGTSKEEEEETYVRSDQQSMEEGDMMRTSKEEEEETYVGSDQQSMEEGDMMRTSKEEEEETYLRSDQHSMEEGDMMRIKKEEEETYVKSDQQSMEEGDMMRTSKKEDIIADMRIGRSPGIRNLSETRLSVSTDCTTDGDVTGQESPADILVTPNIPPDSPHLSNPEGSHTQHRSPPAGGSHSCSTCGKCYKWKSNLVIHERSHTGEKPYSCAECGKCFVQKSHLVSHEISHNGEKPYSCAECGKCFARKPDLVQHERSHTGEKPYSCAECGKFFAHKSHLVIHERCHTGEKPYSCAECGKCFGHKPSLVDHERSHTGEKPYSCAECGKCFAYKSYLVIHERFHSGEKRYSCVECGKCFVSKSHLVTHERSHTGEKPYSCVECGKCFVSKSHLLTHERSHTGEKPYSCAECGKCFARKPDLVQHERSHTGEKPYSCAECGKCFARKSNLFRHERSHTGEKPYSCAECGKCFAQKSHLVWHERSHTGEKPYPCAECGKCFCHKSQLIRHLC
ncbi:uncharacterized protein [Hyperolius riggenbachi]|uniref:uncharacterized protein n=1 Tax=Hyperolius riggenbachi TaxID=752182 RepID=UPI0035A3018A